MGKLLEIVAWLGFPGILTLVTAVILIIMGIRSASERDLPRRPAFLILTAIIYAAMSLGGMALIQQECGGITICSLLISVIFGMVTMKVLHREKIYAIPLLSAFLLALPFIVCGIGGLMAEEGYGGDVNMFHVYYWLQLIIMFVLQLCFVYEDRLPDGLQQTIEDPIQHMTGDEY